jgi:hypothetical protein
VELLPHFLLLGRLNGQVDVQLDASLSIIRADSRRARPGQKSSQISLSFHSAPLIKTNRILR